MSLETGTQMLSSALFTKSMAKSGSNAVGLRAVAPIETIDSRASDSKDRFLNSKKRMQSIRTTKLLSTSTRPTTAAAAGFSHTMSIPHFSRKSAQSRGNQRSSIQTQTSVVNLGICKIDDNILHEDFGTTHDGRPPKVPSKKAKRPTTAKHTLDATYKTVSISNIVKVAQPSAPTKLSFFETSATESQVSQANDGAIVKRPVTLQSKQVLKANIDLKSKLVSLQDIERKLDSVMTKRKKLNEVNLNEQMHTLRRKAQTMQAQLNQIVSSGKQIAMVSPETPTVIEVTQMNTYNIKVQTREHRGPLVLSVDVFNRIDQDLTVYVHTNHKVGSDFYIWKFELRGRTRFPLLPFKAFDKNALSAKQSLLDIDKNLWQPDAIYAQFASTSGVLFTLNANFTEEE